MTRPVWSDPNGVHLVEVDGVEVGQVSERDSDDLCRFLAIYSTRSTPAAALGWHTNLDSARQSVLAVVELAAAAERLHHDGQASR